MNNRKTNLSKYHDKHLLNDQITATTIMLVNDDSTANKKTYTLTDALLKAKQSKLDLVMFNYDNGTAICKLLDYKKYCFELVQKERSRSKALSIKKKSKCIKIHIKSEPGDINLKIKSINRLLLERYKVTCMITCRGNEPNLAERFSTIISSIQEKTSDYGIIQGAPRREARTCNLIIVPDLRAQKSKTK